MTRAFAVLCLLVLSSCAWETGPPGEPSPGGYINPVTGQPSSAH